MKILYVTMQYPVSTETFAMSDVAALRSLGHEVRVECLLPSTEEQRQLAALYQQDIASIGNLRLISYLASITFGLRILLADMRLACRLFHGMWRRPKQLLTTMLCWPRVAHLVRQLRADPPDVIHAFWGHYPSLVPALARRYVPSARTSIFIGAYDLYAGFASKVTSEAVDARFTHSSSNVPLVRAMGIAGNMEVIHRGLPLGEFQDISAVEKDPLLFCTCSALVAAKRVDHALRVFAEVRSRHPGARLQVIGKGEEEPRLRALAGELGISGAVEFLGYRKRKDVFAAMRRSSFFLFFSEKKSDRLPNVVKEAMLAECLCVVSATRGIDELLPDDRHGLVVSLESPTVAADAVSGLLESSGQVERIGRAARSLILERFSAEKSMARYEAAWRGIESCNGSAAVAKEFSAS